MEKSKLRTLCQKKDFDQLKKYGCPLSYQWLKAFFYVKRGAGGPLKVAWSLSKKHIPSAVVRNRLKRWGRELLRQSSLKGLILMVFLQKDQLFYKKLKRKDFNHVFQFILEKIHSKA